MTFIAFNIIYHIFNTWWIKHFYSASVIISRLQFHFISLWPEFHHNAYTCSYLFTFKIINFHFNDFNKYLQITDCSDSCTLIILLSSFCHCVHTCECSRHKSVRTHACMWEFSRFSKTRAVEPIQLEPICMLILFTYDWFTLNMRLLCKRHC